jgi:thiosulfate/3-mercaptopyruvate sulfurtransferase
MTDRGHAEADQVLGRQIRQVRAMLERVGFGPGDHIVTHCEGGGRAALAS